MSTKLFAERLSANNAVLAMIDHQTGLLDRNDTSRSSTSAVLTLIDHVPHHLQNRYETLVAELHRLFHQ